MLVTIINRTQSPLRVITEVPATLIAAGESAELVLDDNILISPEIDPCQKPSNVMIVSGRRSPSAVAFGALRVSQVEPFVFEITSGSCEPKLFPNDAPARLAMHLGAVPPTNDIQAIVASALKKCGLCGTN